LHGVLPQFSKKAHALARMGTRSAARQRLRSETSFPVADLDLQSAEFVGMRSLLGWRRSDRYATEDCPNAAENAFPPFAIAGLTLGREHVLNGVSDWRKEIRLNEFVAYKRN
jgi:hypothetical protein